ARPLRPGRRRRRTGCSAASFGVESRPRGPAGSGPSARSQAPAPRPPTGMRGATRGHPVAVVAASLTTRDNTAPDQTPPFPTRPGRPRLAPRRYRPPRRPDGSDDRAARAPRRPRALSHRAAACVRRAARRPDPPGAGHPSEVVKKGPGFERARIVLGNGLLTSEGDFHLRQRRMMQPAFHRRRIAGYAGIMIEEAQRLSGQMREGEPRDVGADMSQL